MIPLHGPVSRQACILAATTGAIALSLLALTSLICNIGPFVPPPPTTSTGSPLVDGIILVTHHKTGKEVPLSGYPSFFTTRPLMI